MRLLLAMLVLCLALPRAHAQDLNPEWGTEPYQPFSVFHPVGGEYGPKVVVVFHGFKSAVPNGTYKRLFRLLRDEWTVIGVNYDYFDIAGTVAGLDALALALDGREVAVIGTSLGGFWADWWGNRIEASRIVVLNPAIDPAATLAKYAGVEVEAERRAIRFTPSLEEIGRYDALTVAPAAETQILVILTADDPMGGTPGAEAFYGTRARAEIVVFAEGGHTLNLKKHPARETIGAFLLGD